MRLKMPGFFLWDAALFSPPSQTSSQTPSSSAASSPFVTGTGSVTSSSFFSATATPGIVCPLNPFHRLARTDLVGAPLSDAPLAVPLEGACRIACCGAPGCDGYAFAFTELRTSSAASCFLLANVTSTTPANAMTSGLRPEVVLPSAPASASPAGTPLSMGGRPQRTGSLTPTHTNTNTPTASLTPSPTLSPALRISTIAGSGPAAFGGDGEQATSASMNYPTSVAVSSTGALVVTEYGSHRIRLILPSGIISTIAGTGIAGFSGDGGQAAAARMNTPTGVAVTSTGDFVIADLANHRIRLISSGIISTIAGNGVGGYGGDGGQATSASLSGPTSVAMTSAGAIVIADQTNHRIRLLLPSGIISTIAGNGVADFSGDGGQATSASISPAIVAVTATDSVIFSDIGNHRIRLILPSGIISTIAGNGANSFGGDGGQVTSASLFFPAGVALTSTGAVVIADQANQRIRVVDSSGIISTIAGNGIADYGGDGGPATLASLKNPYGIAFTSTGALAIADQSNNRIRLIAPIVPTVSPLPSATPYCAPSLFRSLPRMDLMGSLVGTALTPGTLALTPSLDTCRQACCDAPACDGFSFSVSELAISPTGSASCFLYVNITQLIPNSGYSSGIYESTL